MDIIAQILPEDNLPNRIRLRFGFGFGLGVNWFVVSLLAVHLSPLPLYSAHSPATATSVC